MALPNENKKCIGVHCRCMNLGKQCPNFHSGDHYCPSENEITLDPKDQCEMCYRPAAADGVCSEYCFYERSKKRMKVSGAEIVICAAVRMYDGYVVIGHRHSDAIRTAQAIPRYKDQRPFGENQGFVTSKNRYVNRIEGAKIQKAAGIKSKMPEGQDYLHGELYSEDLY